MNRLIGRRRQPRIVARDPRRRPRRGADASRRTRRPCWTSVPGVANARVGRDDGRPELAVQVDRPKAALLGLIGDQRRQHDPHQRRRHAGGVLPRGRQRVPDHRAAARRGPRARRGRRTTCSSARRRARCCQAKNLIDAAQRSRARPRSSARTRSGSSASAPSRKSTLSEAVEAVQARLPRVQRAARTSRSASAPRSSSRRRRSTSCRLVLILALILVYAVMASQYESLRDPFIIMFSVPLAAIGVVLALKLTGTSFSLQAYIGVIMLAGIVVSNAILLVDYTNILRRRDGMPLREAVETAGRTRLRPILMTSLATMLGLVPMALGIGEGSELQAPLARVVIGGLHGLDAHHAGVRADGLHALRRRLEGLCASGHHAEALVATARRDIMKKLIVTLSSCSRHRRRRLARTTCSKDSARSRRSRPRRSRAATSSTRSARPARCRRSRRSGRHAGVRHRPGAERRLQLASSRRARSSRGSIRRSSRPRSSSDART